MFLYFETVSEKLSMRDTLMLKSLTDIITTITGVFVPFCKNWAT